MLILIKYSHYILLVFFNGIFIFCLNFKLSSDYTSSWWWREMQIVHKIKEMIDKFQEHVQIT